MISDELYFLDSYANRSVILYGNQDTNRAWKLLLEDSPISVTREEVRVGKRNYKGANLGCIFVRPHPESHTASVAVVAGTGTLGSRLGARLPYFVSGIGYPDFTVFDDRVFEKGVEGVRAAGYFEADWSLGEDAVYSF